MDRTIAINNTHQSIKTHASYRSNVKPNVIRQIHFPLSEPKSKTINSNLPDRKTKKPTKHTTTSKPEQKYKPKPLTMEHQKSIFQIPHTTLRFQTPV